MNYVAAFVILSIIPLIIGGLLAIECPNLSGYKPPEPRWKHYLKTVALTLTIFYAVLGSIAVVAFILLLAMRVAFGE